MSKDYMKSGEIREGESLHFDGVGFTTQPMTSQATHFKVNKWMRKQGFVWELDQGTKASPITRRVGVWLQPDDDSDPVEQDEAVRLYQTRTTLSQRLMSALRRHNV